MTSLSPASLESHLLYLTRRLLKGQSKCVLWKLIANTTGSVRSQLHADQTLYHKIMKVFPWIFRIYPSIFKRADSFTRPRDKGGSFARDKLTLVMNRCNVLVARVASAAKHRPVHHRRRRRRLPGRTLLLRHAVGPIMSLIERAGVIPGRNVRCLLCNDVGKH